MVIGIDLIELNFENIINPLIRWDLTPAIYRYEGNITQFIQRTFHSILLTYITSYFYVFVFPALVWVAMAVFNRHNDQFLMKELLLTFILNYAIALPFYLFFPVNEVWYTNKGVHLLITEVYPAFNVQYRALSGLNNCFPSLHTSLSTSLALLSIHSGYKRMARVAVFSSLVIIFSTIYLGIHWLNDVLGGIVVALIVVNIAVVWVEGKSKIFLWRNYGTDDECDRIFLKLDKNLVLVIKNYGTWTYLFLFLIVFLETGIVITPFLPGDSLLFVAGALAVHRALKLEWLYILLCLAAILGDTSNYQVGHFIGPKVFHKENGRLLNKEHLEHAHQFYEKHGGKTIILARFIPVIRTYAPFVAGIGSMNYGRFLSYNIIGAVAWVSVLLFGGYLFGNIPAVRNNFTIVIMAIIFVSILPVIINFIKTKSSYSKKMQHSKDRDPLTAYGRIKPKK
ncbi:DedA family protein [Thermincola ferriacetica]